MSEKIDYIKGSEEKIKFRLPTREEFESLIKHFARWSKEKRGIEVLNDSMDILFLPAEGYYNTSSDYTSSYFNGYYWSSTMREANSKYAIHLAFGVKSKDVYYDALDYRLSVRLVSDTPFDDGVKFGEIWWKPENEDGYYSWTEAMEKFNK